MKLGIQGAAIAADCQARWIWQSGDTVNWSESAAVASFFGTLLAAVPAVRAALYLRHRTRPALGNAPNPSSKFGEFKIRMNARLEAIAQDWPSWLFWSFLFGVALLLYGAGVQGLLTFGVLRISIAAG